MRAKYGRVTECAIFAELFIEIDSILITCMSDQNIVDFEKSGLPNLYYAANTTSIRSQSRYLQLFRAVLGLTVAAPILIFAATLFPCMTQPFRYGALLCLVASLLITGRMKESQQERTWYGARAVAESVKTSAWRYATAAEPFVATLQPAQVDLLFVNTLREILEDKKSLSFSSSQGTDAQPQITDAMRELRSQSWENRREVYLRDRVDDQRHWYTGKARTGERGESLTFWLILGTQLLSIIALGAFAVWSNLRVNVATVFTSTTAALLAWLQVKRYQETAQSYAVTAHELGLIAEAGKCLQSEDDLSKFVADAENAMSREHTLWAARRQSR
jgi:conflict system pore-forming effector with SLATT domain